MTAELTLRPRSRVDRLPARTRLDHFPRDPLRRWLVRLLFFVPFAVAALISAVDPTPTTSSVNAQLVERVAQIDWTRADAAWLNEIYPPLSTLIAVVVPGGRLGLGLVGALAAGVLLQRVLEIMVQRRVPISTATILMLALAANPLFFFMVTENLPAFLGLALFGLGLADIVRFVNWGNTQSGFRAGILLMLATLSDLSGVLYVLTAVAAAPFLRIGRPGLKGLRSANVLVIIYPTAAALGTLALFNLIYLGSPLGLGGDEMIEQIPARFETLTAFLFSFNGFLLVAPVLSAWVIGIIVRRPKSILVSTLVFAALLLAYVLSLLPPGSAGNTFIMMTLLAIALIPTSRSPMTNILVDVVAVAQIVIAWLAAANREVVVEWMDSMVVGFTTLF